MKKLWKQLVMLGALVGCMATAAWAGNVEVGIGPDSLGEGAQIRFAADGYYLMSQDDPNAENVEYEYHFNKNGMVAWKTCGNDTTQYTYDENGNVIRAATVGKRGIVDATSVETYTYDECGRILIFERNYYESHNTYKNAIHQKAVYTYEDHRVYVDYVDEEGDDFKLRNRIEYTLNEKNQVKKMKTYTAVFNEDYGEPEETNFLYDENDNLIQATLGYGTTASTTVYTYMGIGLAQQTTRCSHRPRKSCE